jgi:hypothetical protein
MNCSFRAAGMLMLTALAGCTEQRHPIDLQLSRLRPVTIAPLTGLDWPAGTMLCPLGIYQSKLQGPSPVTERVNAFLTREKFLGDEGYWSLVVVKPTSAGDAGIEQFIFERDDYEVVTWPQVVSDSAVPIPAGFQGQTCVAVENARVLVTHGMLHSTVISFGTD